MKEILQKIVDNVVLEAQWLHTVSLLEFIGARKISKTVCQNGHPSQEILEHLADETRHAYAFKKLSDTLAPSMPQGYLCQNEAVTYFQNLDQQVAQNIQTLFGQSDSYLNYLFVTHCIERRAMKLYPLYRSMTRHEPVKVELQKIIVEEANHMQPIEQKVLDLLKQNGRVTVDFFHDIEEQNFSHFVQALGNFFHRTISHSL